MPFDPRMDIAESKLTVILFLTDSFVSFVSCVKANRIASFLGRKLTAAYKDEVGNEFSTRIEGTRIRHQMGD